MSCAKFFVVARVVGRDGAFPLWKDRLVKLCEVSATERFANSYYWGQDLGGEPDTLWGLEGYTHPIGFFMGHLSSDIFKEEMALVDKDELLRTKQGLESPDYDLHHYDQEGGFLKRADDSMKNSKTSYVALYHFWSLKEDRAALMKKLCEFADGKEAAGLQSCLVLKELMQEDLVTLWIRIDTKEGFSSFESSSSCRLLLNDIQTLVKKTELHQSQSFNGFLDDLPIPTNTPPY